MSLKQKTIQGTFWTFAEQFSVKGINFIVQIILANILAPEKFALIAMMTIVIAIGTAIVDGGMTQSLIRTKDADNRDYSTVFFLNVIVSAFVFIAIFFLAPFIAKFYSQPILTPMVRVFSLIIPIRAFMAIQNTLLTKAMNFKRQVFIQMPSIIVSGIIAILLAKKGYGAWALVYMQLIQTGLMTIQYWFFSNWKPSLIFDIDKLKQHFNFGYKLTLNTFLNSFFTEIYNIIIGKYYSATTLGLYNRAYAFQYLPGFIFARALNKVTYPLFSKIQDDNERLKASYKEITLQVMLVFTPIMVFFYFMAKPFILTLLNEQWLGAVPFLKMLAIGGLALPIQAYNWNILNAKGRSDLVLRVNTISKVITVVGLILVIPLGVEKMVLLQVLISFITLVLFASYSGNFINYKLKEQLLDLTPILIINITSGLLAAYLCSIINMNNIMQLVAFLSLFATIYFCILYTIKYKPFLKTLDLLIKLKNK